jgi:NADH:ubiquinone oxidoreductase subunit F (NADH-binding)/(2Fe-2S) ferredoxin/NAD-dependent dihydropyrimidine dehydrogenase PreA subunit
MSRREVLVCSGTACRSAGAVEVHRRLADLIVEHDLSDEALLTETGCAGPCSQGPLLRVMPDDVLYTQVRPEDAEEIVRDHLIGGHVVCRLLWEGHESLSSIPFFAHQKKSVLANSGVIDPDRIEAYEARGGNKGLKRALTEMSPEAIIAAVEASGLRGRGGAGFPTGRKWRFTSDAPGETKYVVCNADEGDPGAFMDRAILEGDPHAVIEGMTIAARAIGAERGYVYVRAEYPLAIQRVEAAVRQACDRGWLGRDIQGSGFAFQIDLRIGAGAFVCGEETALLASIEGRRGVPRSRPPFPAQSGLYGRPTLINNVETFANVGTIFRDGPEAYSAIGTESSKGTKVFALAGQIRNTGLVEVPIGTTLRQLVFDIGGGVPEGRELKAIQIGGPSGGCLPAELLDVPIDYESLGEHGAIMGSGGVIVLDDTACMVNVARYFLDFTASESCGKCVPCRVGIPTMRDILVRITEGEGTFEDLDRLEELGELVKSASLCGLGQTAPNPVVSTLRYFKGEYVAHIEDRICPSGVCQALALPYTIDPEACKACDQCAKVCPTDAARGTPGEPPYVIDEALCIRCGACFKACPFGAVIRAAGS